MAPIRDSIRVLLFLCVAVATARGQLDPEQERIKAAAQKEASKLIFGTTSARTATASEAEYRLYQVAAARLEAQMLKVAATKEAAQEGGSSSGGGGRKMLWEFISSEQVTTTSPAPSQQQVATETAAALPAGFNPDTAAKLRRDKNYVGGNIRNNFIKGMMTWQDCCKECYTRSDCKAWTVNTGRPASKRGCYLKGKGYRTKYANGYISGVMVAGARDGGSPALSPSPSPSPPPSPQLPEPTYSPSPPFFPSPSPPPSPSPSPSPPSSPLTRAPPLPGGKGKYAELLGASWEFYEAQRSGPTPPWNRVSWRGDSHLDDPVPGGWYDAGDYLKLNFPLAPTVGMLAWGLLEFRDAHVAAGQLKPGMNNLRVAADYLARCLDWDTGKYTGQIGDPGIDHAFWGRPEEQHGERPALLYDRSMPAADLYGAVAGALASSALVFRGDDPAFADGLLRVAVELYAWGLDTRGGKYSNFFVKQTKSIYPSTDYQDSMAWGGGWLWRATGDAAYLTHALDFWTSGSPDIYPGWDSVWAPHAAHMVAQADQGEAIPGADTYRAYMARFARAWTAGDGTESVVSTPLGLHYPAWNEWGNLAISTAAAAVMAVHAKHTPDAGARAAALDFAQRQVDYAAGAGLRSYVVGWGFNPPQHAHHAAASCSSVPAKCDWKTFEGSQPNGQVLRGALVAGPAGQRKNSAAPDAAYNDKRSDYVTNEVANDYNAGFTVALAGLYQLLS